MNQNLSVSFDAKRAFLNKTGLGNYSRTTLQALNTYYPEVQLNLFTPSISDIFTPSVAGKNNRIITPTFFWRMNKSIWRRMKIGKEAEKLNSQIFHGLSNEMPVFGKRKKIKTIVTIHDLIFLRYPQFYNTTDRKIYTAKVKQAISKSDCIMAISQRTKLDLIELLHADEQKIKVVYQSINSNLSSISGPSDFEKIKTKFKLPDNYILNVGTIEERKNVGVVVKALKEIDPDISLVIIGNKKAYFSELTQIIKQEKLEKRVVVLSNVNNDDLAIIYANAKVFVYPSLYEGFGLPVAEAMQFNIPVVSATGSCLEEVGDKASLYANPKEPLEWAEKINLILKSETISDSMKNEARNQLEKFTAKNFADQLMQTYQSLL